MEIGTGKTVYEQIVSLNEDNNPVTATTFDVSVYKDASVFTGLTVNIALIDASRGVFSATWSASTTGDYQIYFKNNVTNVIFITDSVVVKPDSELDTTIYVGL
jgi:hypothetical protein